MYKLQSREQVIVAVLRDDGTSIPIDGANTDYQQYLKWLEEGNQPLPPDTPDTQGASQ